MEEPKLASEAVGRTCQCQRAGASKGNHKLPATTEVLCGIEVTSISV